MPGVWDRTGLLRWAPFGFRFSGKAHHARSLNLTAKPIERTMGNGSVFFTRLPPFGYRFCRETKKNSLPFPPIFTILGGLEKGQTQMTSFHTGFKSSCWTEALGIPGSPGPMDKWLRDFGGYPYNFTLVCSLNLHEHRNSCLTSTCFSHAKIRGGKNQKKDRPGSPLFKTTPNHRCGASLARSPLALRGERRIDIGVFLGEIDGPR